MADVKISALPAAVVLADTDEFALNSSGTNKKIAGLLLLPRDVVVAAATRIIASKLLAGDAQPAHRFLGDGKHEWGPGGSTAPDTNLYRLAANRLATDGMFTVGGSITATPNIYLRSDSGKHYFGLSDDANLYRSAAGVLKTDSAFVSGALSSFTINATSYIRANQGVANNEVVLGFNGSSNGPYIIFGTNNAWDTNLYRVAAGVLKTDGALYVMGADSSGIGLYVPSGMIYKSGVGSAGAYTSLVPGDSNFRFSIDHNGQHAWGPGNGPSDAFLSRVYAGALSLNGLLALSETSAGATALAALVTGDPNYRFTVGADGKLIWGPGPTAGDTNLYRIGVNTLRTDGTLYIGAGAVIDAGGTNTRLYFGSALDTNLYRLNAGNLKTDNTFWVGGGAVVDAANLGSKLYFGSALDTNVYRAAAGVLKTDGAFASGAYGTSLPASPVDGQEFTLVDSITNPSYQWRFRYNASSVSAYKWEFVGGSPLLAFFGAQQGVVPVATWTSGAPPMTVPRAGEYRAGISANASLATNVLAQVGLTTDGVNPLASTPSLATFTGDVTINQSDIPLTLAASANLQHIYWNSVSNVLWGSRRTSLLPVRVS